jgi:transposase
MVSTMKMVDTKKAALASDGVRVNRTGRRTYTAAYKLDMVRRCREPGVSVAAVAMAHGINANLVRRWIVRHRCDGLDATPKRLATLLPVAIETPVSVGRERGGDQIKVSTRRNRCAGASIEIELRGVRIHLRGAVDATALTAVIDVLSRR